MILYTTKPIQNFTDISSILCLQYVKRSGILNNSFTFEWQNQELTRFSFNFQIYKYNLKQKQTKIYKNMVRKISNSYAFRKLNVINFSFTKMDYMMYSNAQSVIIFFFLQNKPQDGCFIHIRCDTPIICD